MAKLHLVIYVVLIQHLKQYHCDICSPAPFDKHSKPTDLTDCQLETPHWGSTTFGFNECYDKGGVLQDYDCKVGDNSEKKSCSLEVSCPRGKYLNSTGHCVKTFVDCYFNAGDIVPKNVILPAGNCGDKDWKAFRPDFCSISTSDAKCEEDGRSVLLNYVTRDDGSRVFVNQLSVEMSQSKPRDEAYFMDRRNTLSEGVIGTKEYCDLMESNKRSCYSNSTKEGHQYRILKREGLIPYLHMGTCKVAIRGYGAASAIVFDKKREIQESGCVDCKVTCSKTKVTISIPKTGEKVVRLCGRSGCMMMESPMSVMEADRTFHSKISDEKMTAQVTDIQKTYSYNLETKCPVVGTCDAIECHFCYLRLVNVSCYEWYHFVITLLILYFSMIFVSLILSFILPITKAVWFVVTILFRLVRKISQILMGSSSKKMRQVRDYAMDVESQSTPMIRTNYTTTRNGIPSMIGYVVIYAILSMGLCHAPCSTSVADNLKSDHCVKINEVLQCRTTSVTIIPILSYDQTSCMHYIGPNGDIIGEVQITPVDLHFKCGKVHEFWTRDVEFISDHIVHCPHAADCTVEWCPTVNKETNVLGFTKRTGPLEQFCKLGDACWGEGCFYCSNSCHVVRYYPRARTPEIFEIFSCSKWEPAGTFYVEWKTTKGSGSNTVSMIHGQTVEVLADLTITLDFTVQTKYPVLNKHFITDGKRTALIDHSPKGQPQPGTIGAFQCTNKAGAQTMEDCIMAPNTCICNPNGGSDSCDCAQISVSSIMSGSQQLPIQIGDDYLESQRETVSMKAGAFGSANIKIRSTQKMMASSETPPDCVISSLQFTGCHSCLSGAHAQYVCTSLKPSTIVLQCKNDLDLVLSCDNTGTKRTVRANFQSPIISSECETPCSKKGISITGMLESVGFISLNSGSHIQLGSVESHLGWVNWFKGVWFSMGWLNVFWIALSFITIVLILVITNKVVYGVTRKMKRW
ncbi:GPC protein [Sefomo virus]|nr:GPC protein [Sefomo virus]